MARSCALLGVLAWAAAGAAPASATHIAGATYNGNSAGGPVSFAVTPDGGGISHFSIEGPIPNDCGSVSNFSKNYAQPLPITNHAFSDGSSTFMLNGSFSGPQSASGTYRIKTTFYMPSPVTCDTGEVAWNATTTATPPQPDPDPDPDPQPDPIDTTAPVLALSGKKSQKAGKAVKVGVACASEACVATASGFVDVPRTGVAKRLKLKRARANIAAGEMKKLKLRIPRKTRRAIQRALRRVKAVKAVVRVVVLDAAGNRTVRKRTVRLKR